MRKYQRKIILTMTILLLLSSYAFASSSAQPMVTFAKTKMTVEMTTFTTVSLPGNSSIESISSRFPIANEYPLNADQSTLNPAISPGAPGHDVYTSQPLGRLTAIAWNNLDTLAYPSFFPQLLIFAFNHEPWLQWIAPGKDPDTNGNVPHVNVALPQETERADALLLSMNTRGDVGISCSACHSLPNRMYPTLVALNNQPPIPQQGHPETIVDCVVCHT